MLQRLFSASIAAVLIFAMIAFPATAARTGSESIGGRATGGVQYQVADIQRQVQLALAAQSDGTAKGIFHYSDEYGEWYKVFIQHAHVEGARVYFAGEVIAASRDEWIGVWVAGTVQDGGSTGADAISAAFSTRELAVDTVRRQTPPTQWHPVESGNILVSSSAQDLQ